MADLTVDVKPSPSQDDMDSVGNGTTVDNRVPRQRPRMSAPDDDDDDDDKPGRERRKIEIKFIQDKSRRHITFSKRKAGIMKKVGRVNRIFWSQLQYLLHGTIRVGRGGRRVYPDLREPRSIQMKTGKLTVF